MVDPKAPELTLADLEGLADYLLNPHAGTRQTYARFVCNDDMSALLAAARRDADVRTLDDYVASLSTHHGWTLSTYSGGVWGVVFTTGQWTELPRVPCLEGATPDEARSAAAAWVRSQPPTSKAGEP